MKKELKTIKCKYNLNEHIGDNKLSWEGSIIIYDGKYFEGIVKEINIDGYPEYFISGYIIDDKIITFDKFPESTTVFDDIAFFAKKMIDRDTFFHGIYAPIMPCGNCPSFYKSLYNHNNSELNFFDKIKDLFPCEDDEIITLFGKSKKQIPDNLYYTAPLNAELKYTINSTISGDYIDTFIIWIDNKKILEKPETVIFDEKKLEQKIETFKNDLREFDMYLYKNISENREEKYNKLLKKISNIDAHEIYTIKPLDKVYIDEDFQEKESTKKRASKIKDKIKHIFKS